MERSFYFPMMGLVPAFKNDVFVGKGFVVHARKWDVSIFDLYSLVAKKHTLRLPAELMQVFLGQVNLEIETCAVDFPEAAEILERIRLLLYMNGIMPTLAPFASNYSINAYAGINDRSGQFREKLHQDLREGITHETARVETWPHELTFSCILGSETSADVTDKALQATSDSLAMWTELERRQPVLRAARKAFVKAPLMPDVSSSILHTWQGIESLFPTVNAEVTFRTSILLAMLLARFEDKVDTFNKSKKSYGVRSKISHGSQAESSMEQWMEAWSLLRDALKSVMLWNRLPSEQDLTMHLVGGSAF
ncbi:HEPN domain-containing protein [Rhizobium sp. BT-175]|uniref:HEPN domain-containing protein n=1 Tax=Rhizobium sp. BT-175 TaxID=2986929 RepID=UPI0022358A57|nr:HEPN domain-containing protein [Rhizobium sp. BT-175]MCV9944920.1 HEPN domain-containing protein [Rhizobium sp. BT-175]